MEWQDEGIILHTQSLGERKQVISLFTLSHGRCAGVFQATQKSKGWVQCGGKVKARWGARLENHIGYWNLEPLGSNTAYLLDSPGPLSALLSAATLCQLALPERQTYPHLYAQFQELLQNLTSTDWARAYVFFELTLLKEMGYGLDLETCAVTGSTSDLVAVSPRTGRAVCESVAKPYEGRLLPLPSFIYQEIDPNDKEILDALRLTGYFLERYVLGRTLPAARMRLLQRFISMRNCV
ncbi:MAG: DNA repair protein RecO [Alphaproteobacteria bacterium]|nr:DNA repair protein RecO [Alphaproteobacteria bacterium]